MNVRARWGGWKSCCGPGATRRGPKGTLNDTAKPANYKPKTHPSVYLWDRTMIVWPWTSCEYRASNQPMQQSHLMNEAHAKAFLLYSLCLPDFNWASRRCCQRKPQRIELRCEALQRQTAFRCPRLVLMLAHTLHDIALASHSISSPCEVLWHMVSLQTVRLSAKISRTTHAKTARLAYTLARYFLAYCRWAMSSLTNHRSASGTSASLTGCESLAPLFSAPLFSRDTRRLLATQSRFHFSSFACFPFVLFLPIQLATAAKPAG